MKGKKIVGDRFFLVPSSAKMITEYDKWFKDPLVLRGLKMKESLNEVDLKKWIRTGVNSPEIVRFEVVEKSTKNIVGFCQLTDIDAEARSAKVWIFIGDPVYRYRGFGCEILNLLCRYALNELKLHSIWCEVPSYNSGALSIFNKQGFTDIGHRSHAGFIDGKYYNLHIFEMLNMRC